QGCDRPGPAAKADHPHGRPVVLGDRAALDVRDVSAQPPGESATGAALKSLTGGTAHHGGLGWWWHTTEDTPDKIDKANLHRDAQVYALALWRWCTAPVLPLDYRETAAELRETLRGIQQAAGDSFDM